jgi:hypothetical protein
VLAKQVRRRWRAGHGTPAQRLVGAWREVVDRLIEAGVPVPASRTGRELARDLGGGPAAPVSRHVADLAPLVAGAVFGVEEPEESVVQRAWALEARVRRELAASLPLLVRLRALLDPRPLVPRIARRRGTGSRPRWSRGREQVGTR